MLITLACGCGRPITPPDDAAGLQGRCRGCGAGRRMPAATEARPGPTDSPAWRLLVSRAKATPPNRPGGLLARSLEAIPPLHRTRASRLGLG